jgi:hypothetical protein
VFFKSSRLAHHYKGEVLMTLDRPTLVPEPDANDGKQWSEIDLEDLAPALKDGGTIEGAAFFLGRAGTMEDVRRKAEELGLATAATLFKGSNFFDPKRYERRPP